MPDGCVRPTVVSGGVEFLYLGLSAFKTAENYPCRTARFKTGEKNA